MFAYEFLPKPYLLCSFCIDVTYQRNNINTHTSHGRSNISTLTRITWYVISIKHWLFTVEKFHLTTAELGTTSQRQMSSYTPTSQGRRSRSSYIYFISYSASKQQYKQQSMQVINRAQQQSNLAP